MTAPVTLTAAVPGPVVAAPSLAARFAAAALFPAFMAAATANAELWRALYARAHVSDEAVARAVALAGPWYLLVLAEDWCGDAVNTVPVLARLTERAPNVALRVLQRDANLDLMDTHLTNGSRSIPAVLVLDVGYIERGWWGPRPGALQTWVMTEGRQLDKEARYREVRRWYAHDRGATTVDEVLGIIERAAAAAGAAPPLATTATRPLAGAPASPAVAGGGPAGSTSEPAR